MRDSVNILRSACSHEERAAALSHIHHVAHSIAGVAETLGLHRAGQQARSILLFLHAISAQGDANGQDEALELVQEFERLAAAVDAESGNQDRKDMN